MQRPPLWVFQPISALICCSVKEVLGIWLKQILAECTQTRIRESENHRTIWVGRSLKGHPVWTFSLLLPWAFHILFLTRVHNTCSDVIYNSIRSLQMLYCNVIISLVMELTNSSRKRVTFHHAPLLFRFWYPKGLKLQLRLMAWWSLLQWGCMWEPSPYPRPGRVCSGLGPLL